MREIGALWAGAALLIGLSAGPVAAQSAAPVDWNEERRQLQAHLQAAVDAFIDAALANDEVRFRALSTPANAPQVDLLDNRSGRLKLLTFDALSRLARSCRPAPQQPEFFYTEPHSISIAYTCGSELGFRLTAFWGQDNRGIESLSIDAEDIMARWD